MMLCLSAVAFAAPVSQQKARQMAESFLLAHGKTLTSHAPVKSPARHGQDAGAPAYFIFHAAEGGFVVVSGEDCTAPVLGYGERGSFDAANMPEGLSWLLQMYEEQIGALRTQTGNAPAQQKPAHAVPVRHTIEPLMTTLWNQGEPYNLLCPHYYNQDGSEGPLCATGCVATAVAQVMAFYKYPQATKRTIPGYVAKFSTDQGEKSVQLRNIPANSVIDWENMLDVYHGGETDAQNTAVAQLMYWVGLGCKMSYGASSAAGFPDAVNALIRYFGYDDGTHIESRGNHSIQSWNDLLYNELATGHPIPFAGTNSGGAHAFVIDGYDVEGLYHLNWGWGGMDNGYFRIEVLDPDDNSGIGASPTIGGYNMGQDAIIGMNLPDETASPAVAFKLTVNDWEIRNGDTFFANYVNWSGVSADWNMGIAKVSDDGGLVLVGNAVSVYLNPNYYMGWEFAVRDLAEGSHRIVPVSKRSSDTEWQADVNPAIRFVQADVDAEGGVSLVIHPIEEVEVADISFPGNHKRGDSQRVCASFRNLGEEYYHEVHLFASRNSTKGESLCRTAVTMVAGGETTASFNFTPDQAGTWNVWLAADDRGNKVLGQTTVQITNDGVPSTDNLRCLSLSVSNRSNGVIYGQCAEGKVSVLNQGNAAYDGLLRLWLFKLADNGYYYGASSIYVPVKVEPGARAYVPFFFENLELNATYAMSVIYGGGGDIQDGGLKQMGRTQKGVVCWLSDNTLSGMAPASFINTPAKALAVDMRAMGDAVTKVNPNSNPNTLYLLEDGANVPEGLEESNVIRGGQADRIMLHDGWEFLSPMAFSADEVTFSCEPAKQRWQTLALPFAPDGIPEGIRIMEFNEVGDNGVPAFGEVSSMERNIPYLLWAEADAPCSFKATGARFSATRLAPMVVGTERFRFCGTTVKVNLDGIWTINDAADAFVLSEEVVQVKPFTAYFRASDHNGAIPLPAGGENGVMPVVTQGDASAVYYNLNGQRVSRPQKGVYITNHKKIRVW